MQETTLKTKIERILRHMPEKWLRLTTHRLDIYNEKRAKTQFLEELQGLITKQSTDKQSWENLPSAYDYIRLGHQLSSVLEWALGEINHVSSEQVISFSSKKMALLAIMRHNSLLGRKSVFYVQTDDPPFLDHEQEKLKTVYGYDFQFHQVNKIDEIATHPKNTVIFINQSPLDKAAPNLQGIDITVNLHPRFGSLLIFHQTETFSEEQKAQFLAEIQRVRRRETTAMSPQDCYQALRSLAQGEEMPQTKKADASLDIHRATIHQCIRESLACSCEALIASSGLSIQYGILMGLIDHSLTSYPNHPIKLLIPPNCYGGTHDQAKRITNLLPQASLIDIPVDSGRDMTTSLEAGLSAAANHDGIPIIIVEIPTNPRVEVPNFEKLISVLTTSRSTPSGTTAIKPILIIDQTFCPNIPFLGEASPFAEVKTLSYISGSKFPSAGHCTAGYVASNQKAQHLLEPIRHHLALCDNGASPFQLKTLAEQMPSMIERIKKAHLNAQQFVDHVTRLIPDIKLNFVSRSLAQSGFKASVCSFDLPILEGKGKDEQKALNRRLIDHMISHYPEGCTHCVSYGQGKGSYWTIPATSTQGTTEEKDKDYLVRVAFSPNVDMERITAIFNQFCYEEKLGRSH